MTDFASSDKGVTIRQPSTANLMLDSADRIISRFPLANNFQITKPQALLNGFFTRAGTTELVLDWGQPNVSRSFNNVAYTVDISGGTGVTGVGTLTGTVGGGFVNAAAYCDIIKDILDAVGSQTTPATTWTLANPSPGTVTLTPNQDTYINLEGSFIAFGRLTTNGYVRIDPAGTNPAVREYLIIGGGEPDIVGTPGSGPVLDLRAVRYLDFVSPELTYNQDVKDASTAPLVRDVLARWYMAYDNQVATDAYGFPILMGYAPFSLRRIFSPPKQIKWAANQPVGNLAFTVYTDTGLIAPMVYSNWLMTLQLSEV